MNLMNGVEQTGLPLSGAIITEVPSWPGCGRRHAVHRQSASVSVTLPDYSENHSAAYFSKEGVRSLRGLRLSWNYLDRVKKSLWWHVSTQIDTGFTWNLHSEDARFMHSTYVTVH